MRTLYFNVKGQKIEKSGNFESISKGWQNYLKCSFSFDNEWRKMTKVAEFHISGNTDIYSVLVSNNTVLIPNEMSGANAFCIKLIGRDENAVLIETNDLHIRQV